MNERMNKRTNNSLYSLLLFSQRIILSLCFLSDLISFPSLMSLSLCLFLYTPSLQNCSVSIIAKWCEPSAKRRGDAPDWLSITDFGSHATRATTRPMPDYDMTRARQRRRRQRGAPRPPLASLALEKAGPPESERARAFSRFSPALSLARSRDVHFFRTPLPAGTHKPVRIVIGTGTTVANIPDNRGDR